MLIAFVTNINDIYHIELRYSTRWLKIAGPLKTFYFEEKLNIVRYSFITMCGGIKGQKEKITQELTKSVQKKPQRVVEFWVNDCCLKN